MQVMLDGVQIAVRPETLAAALDAGRREAESRRRVVVEARIDGRAMSEDEIAAPAGHLASECLIEFISAEPSSLVRVTLLELVPLLQTASEDQRLAAEHMQAGTLQPAYEHLGAALEVWNAVNRAVGDGLALLGLEISQVRVATPLRGEVALTDCTTALADRLGEIKRAMGAGDLSGLADALMYDMKDQASEWQAVLAALAEQSRATPD